METRPMMSRPQTVDEYREMINLVLTFILTHLDDSLELDDLAAVAGFSSFHFHRIFAAFTGEPCGSYIRRMRLERARRQLAETAASVTQAAVSAGFETPAAFSRAFRQHFGVPPSQAALASLKPGYRKMSKVKQTRSTIMEPEIRTYPDRQVITVLRRGLIDGNFNEAANQSFAVLERYVKLNRLEKHITVCLGITPDDVSSAPPQQQRYYAGFILEPGTAVTPMGEVEVRTFPAGRYAVFQHKGPYETLYLTWQAIYHDWLPASGLTLRDVDPFEVYLKDKRKVKPEDLLTEIEVAIE
jgi:AraC family transcriptional regulator